MQSSSYLYAPRCTINAVLCMISAIIYSIYAIYFGLCPARSGRWLAACGGLYITCGANYRKPYGSAVAVLTLRQGNASLVAASCKAWSFALSFPVAIMHRSCQPQAACIHCALHRSASPPVSGHSGCNYAVGGGGFHHALSRSGFGRGASPPLLFWFRRARKAANIYY